MTTSQAARPSLTVYKIGGGILDAAAELPRFLDLLARQPGLKLLVHGGGKGASALLRERGHEPQMLHGRRITDAATLEVVTMFYAGKTNKQLVAALQARGLNALGLSGADADVLRGIHRPPAPVDYGFVGDLTAAGVGAARLHGFLAAGLLPVLCPLIHDGHGQLLNTNADTIAAAVAIALAGFYAVTLHYCFEKNGVLRDVNDEQSVIAILNPLIYAELRAQEIINAGMLPKLDNAFAALAQGVERVIIGHALNIGTEMHTKLCPS